ncbi:MAG: CBS domain-containing protein [Bacteroidota bacterium]
MGEHNLNTKTDKKARQAFTRHLLNDIEALEEMLKDGKIESGITRIGAEQEFCLVNKKSWRPTTTANSVMKSANDPHFTSELAKYNLEINLDPLELKDNAFSLLETQLNELLQKAHEAAAEHDSRVVMSGILPTITTKEMDLNYMTYSARYFALNEMLTKLKSGDFHVQLFGVDELLIKHDSMMYEACNTSFQMHLQIDPDDFMSSYNWSQAIAGPILGLSVNSPLLFGKELWQETRIPLFQQSIDTREVSYVLKDQQARVSFGDSWATGSIADFYKNEICRYRIILSREIEESALSALADGRPPKMQALNLHNGTIYRWNRPCYGVGGGKAHLRIENRYIPSGPSVSDQLANFAFWVGLMVGRPAEYDDIHEKMDFCNVKANFVKAARYGSETQMHWMGKMVPLKKLVTSHLLPIAREGLKKMNIREEDSNRLLDIIEKRITKGTPAQWMIESYRQLKKKVKVDKALIALTKATYDNQKSGRPSHQWRIVKSPLRTNVATDQVGHIMSTKLLTAFQDDAAALTLQIMSWQNIHHVPVVDQTEKLVGLLTWTHIQRFNEQNPEKEKMVPVSEIMEQNVLTADTSTPIKDAIKLMKKHEIGCLPVLQKQTLVGIITVEDLRTFDRE